MTIYEVKNTQDLKTLADERGISTEGRPTWTVVDELIRDYEYEDVNPGPDEEILRMACKLAVRNADPTYRGYTPFGEIG